MVTLFLFTVLPVGMVVFAMGLTPALPCPSAIVIDPKFMSYVDTGAVCGSNRVPKGPPELQNGLVVIDCVCAP